MTTFSESLETGVQIRPFIERTQAPPHRLDIAARILAALVSRPSFNNHTNPADISDVAMMLTDTLIAIEKETRT